MRGPVNGGSAAVRRPDVFHYVFSSDIPDFVEIKVGNLEGIFRDPRDLTRQASQLTLQIAVYCNGRNFGYPVMTSFSESADHHQKRGFLQAWNQWLTLPIRYNELSRDAFLHITMWDQSEELTRSVSSLSHFFDDLNQNESEIEKERVLDEFGDELEWPGSVPSRSFSDFPSLMGKDVCKGNPSVMRSNKKGCRLIAESTMNLFCPNGVMRNGVVDLQLKLADDPNPRRPPCEPWQFRSEEASEDIDLLIREYESSRERLEADSMFLTRFTVSSMEKLKNELQRKRSQRSVFLVLQLPIAQPHKSAHRYDIIYQEKELPMVSRRFNTVGVTDDNELGMDNPCEAMHHFMARTSRPGALDKNAKPNKQTKDKLDAILQMPPSRPLSVEQRDLLWRFRFYLQTDRNALTKFIRSVSWETNSEVEEALQLIEDWVPIYPEDALELLSPDFTHPKVRQYAVHRLLSAAPEKLQLFLPQFVQALKYEPHLLTVDYDVALANLLLLCSNPEIAVFAENVELDRRFKENYTRNMKCIQAVETSTTQENSDLVEVTAKRTTSDDLASFLIQYATSYLQFANSLFWHLKVEEEAASTTAEHKQMYKLLRKQLVGALEKSNTFEAQQRARSLEDQEEFVAQLRSMATAAKSAAGSREMREAALREALVKNKKFNKMENLVLPLEPNFRMTGIVAERTTLFKSAMMPARLTFKGKSAEERNFVNETYTVIYKQGDDMRQDQLVMQMIRLMDTLLKESQLDLKLTPYAVLATGSDEGFVQFIKATPLRDVLQKHGSIQDAMRAYRPSSSSMFGIEEEVIDNYIRSLAGYSVICNILGVSPIVLEFCCVQE